MTAQEIGGSDIRATGIRATDIRPLCDFPLNCPLVVASVDLPEHTRRRIAELGIRPGAQISSTQRTCGRGCVISVAGARIAVDRSTVRAVKVAAAGTPA